MFEKFKKLLYHLQDEYGSFKIRGEYYPDDNLLVIFYNDYIVAKGKPEFFQKTSYDQLRNQIRRQIKAIKMADKYFDNFKPNVGGWKRGKKI